MNTIRYNKEGWICDIGPYYIPVDDECSEIEITDDDFEKIQYVDMGTFWRIVDGKIKKEPYGEIPVFVQIDELKSKLRSTDYQAIKYSEGQLSEEEYAPMKAQRQAWRDEINRLEELE